MRTCSAVYFSCLFLRACFHIFIDTTSPWKRGRHNKNCRQHYLGKRSCLHGYSTFFVLVPSRMFPHSHRYHIWQKRGAHDKKCIDAWRQHPHTYTCTYVGVHPLHMRTVISGDKGCRWHHVNPTQIFWHITSAERTRPCSRGRHGHGTAILITFAQDQTFAAPTSFPVAFGTSRDVSLASIIDHKSDWETRPSVLSAQTIMLSGLCCSLASTARWCSSGLPGSNQYAWWQTKPLIATWLIHYDVRHQMTCFTKNFLWQAVFLWQHKWSCTNVFSR